MESQSLSNRVIVGWRSERSQALHDALDYLCRCNSLMQGQPRIAGQMGALSDADLDAMDVARCSGMTPELFVKRLIAQRAAS